MRAAAIPSAYAQHLRACNAGVLYVLKGEFMLALKSHV